MWWLLISNCWFYPDSSIAGGSKALFRANLWSEAKTRLNSSICFSSTTRNFACYATPTQTRKYNSMSAASPKRHTVTLAAHPCFISHPPINLNTCRESSWSSCVLQSHVIIPVKREIASVNCTLAKPYTTLTATRWEYRFSRSYIHALHR